MTAINPIGYNFNDRPSWGPGSFSAVPATVGGSPYQDFQDYFTNTPSGTTQPWAGGSITMGDQGAATYTNPLGQTRQIFSGSNISDLYNSSPYIQQQWDTQYGPEAFAGVQPPAGPQATFDLSQIRNPYSTSGSKSSSWSGLPSQYGQELSTLLGTVNEMIPYYEAAQERMNKLPTDIDRWTEDILKRYRVGGDDIINQLNRAANIRAGQGIMGGTEADNLRANLLGQLAANVNQQRTGALQNALLQKAAAITEAPKTAAIPMSVAPSLYNAARESKSSGSRSSYQEDTAAIPSLIVSLIRAGFTG